MYIVKWKSTGLYYNKATRAFDIVQPQEATPITESELDMMYYKWDDDIVAVKI